MNQRSTLLPSVVEAIGGTPLVELSRITKNVDGRILAKLDHLNPGYLLIYGNEGPMPHQDCMRSIELLGKEVIPALHEIKLEPYESKGKAGELKTGMAGLAP